MRYHRIPLRRQSPAYPINGCEIDIGCFNNLATAPTVTAVVDLHLEPQVGLKSLGDLMLTMLGSRLENFGFRRAKSNNVPFDPNLSCDPIPRKTFDVARGSWYHMVFDDADHERAAEKAQRASDTNCHLYYECERSRREVALPINLQIDDSGFGLNT